MEPPSALVSTVLLTLLLQTKAWTADNFPNPMTDPEKCNRGDVLGWVCDPDKRVSKFDLDVLEGRVRHIYNGEEPYGQDECPDADSANGLAGWEVAVAVVRRVDNVWLDAATKVERFAQKLHSRLGIGNAACGTGVLLAVSIEDRQVYISSGRDALEKLDTYVVAQIIERMRPDLKAANYGKALNQAVVDIGMALSSEKAPFNWSFLWWPVLGVGAVIFWCVVSACRHCRRQRHHADAGRRLRQMQRDLKEANAGRYLSTTCPICLDDFEAKPPTPTAPQLPRKGSDAAAPEATQTSALLANPAAAAGVPSPTAKVPFLLPCGHTFCEPCILQWLKTHDTCPVCRHAGLPGGRAPGPSDRPAGDLPRPPPSDGGNNTGGSSGSGAGGSFRPPRRRGAGHECCQYVDRPYLGHDLYMPEFAFRMSQMRRRYPVVITPGMERDMNARASSGQPLAWAQHDAFVAAGPCPVSWADHIQAALAQEGSTSHGAHSFGGGHSSGGHGGGW